MQFLYVFVRKIYVEIKEMGKKNIEKIERIVNLVEKKVLRIYLN